MFNLVYLDPNLCLNFNLNSYLNLKIMDLKLRFECVWWKVENFNVCGVKLEVEKSVCANRERKERERKYKGWIIRHSGFIS